jgi:hypothetical protein
MRERVLEQFFTLPLIPSPQGRGYLRYLAACCGVIHYNKTMSGNAETDLKSTEVIP